MTSVRQRSGRRRQRLGLRGSRFWRQLRVVLASPARLISADQRREIAEEIYEAGELTPAYGFMLFAACGIAALGLLQSSVAVVIGAMLISPLMGPIMAMGMALARFEPRAFRSAAVTLGVGAMLSVCAATLIVWAVPLKDATPEILARTRPTLLDLIVAVLSGFVGAYLAINRKSGSLVGVAIATALMPPLATVGYGLATASWSYAGGALLLFATNVIAILAAVFGVASRYGFRPVTRDVPRWEGWALGAVILLLCIPLALSLRDIVYAARETGRVRIAIARVFQGAQPHITELVVQAEPGRPPDVQSVIITRRYVSDAARQVAKSLSPGATVVIEQVVSDAGLPKAPASGSALSARPAASLTAAPEEQARAMLSRAGEVVSVRRVGDALDVTMVLAEGASIADYRAVEQAAAVLAPALPVRVHPPILPLPQIAFARGRSDVDEAGRAKLSDVAWALSRWGDPRVAVEGHASAGPRGETSADLRLAAARAASVAAALRDLGVRQVGPVGAVVDVVEGAEERGAWSTKLKVAPRVE